MIFVGPFQAPEQTIYVPLHISIQPVDPKYQRCAWFPVCKEQKQICGGSQKSSCRNFKDHVNDTAFVAHMMELKRAYQNERKRLYMQASRAQKRQHHES